jgi:hypothetical protein
VATLTEIKNGTKRKVPQSKQALELLELLPAPEEGGSIFGLTTKSLDTLFVRRRFGLGSRTLPFMIHGI